MEPTGGWTKGGQTNQPIDPEVDWTRRRDGTDQHQGMRALNIYRVSKYRITTMGWFFLFRVVRPRGDVPGDLGF
jgi:hypothetical protein